MKKRSFEIENPTDTHKAIWDWWKSWICADGGMHPVATEKLIEVFVKAGWKAPDNTPVGRK